LRNIRVLQRIDPDLAARLCLPVDSGHVQEHDSESPRLKTGRDFQDLAQTPEALQSAIEDVEPGERVLVFGFGLGETLDALKDTAKVVAWDQDPWMFRCALSRWDLRSALATGQLRLALGVDLLDLIDSPRDRVIFHPLLSRVYNLARHLLTAPQQGPWAFVCQGELFVADLAEALQQLGYRVYPWDTSRLSKEELAHTAERVNPEAVFAVNYRNGLAEACAELNLKLACWEIDPCVNPPACSAPPESVWIHTWRKANIESFQQAGFSQVEWLPLAANEKRRQPVKLSPQESEHYGAPVSFVGASTLDRVVDCHTAFNEALRRAHPAEALLSQEIVEAVLSDQRADFSVYRVPELVETLFPSWCAAEVEAGRPDPSGWLGEISAAEKRLNIVAGLGQFNIQVWGDAGWKNAEVDGACYRGMAGHYREINRIYNASQVNLDIGRIYQSEIVTMRVFDVLACGGFLLAEHNEALEELFEVGSELETWRTPEELTDKIQYYLEHPDESANIARKGRERLCRDHTIQQRVRKMLAGLSKNSWKQTG
jgi:spore maturation protein CgeB